MQEKRAIFTLAEHNLHRYGLLLESGTIYSVELRQGDYKNLRAFIAITTELLTQWRTIISSVLKTKIEEELKMSYSRSKSSVGKHGNFQPSQDIVGSALRAWGYVLDAQQEVLGIQLKEKGKDTKAEDFGIENE